MPYRYIYIKTFFFSKVKHKAYINGIQIKYIL